MNRDHGERLRALAADLTETYRRLGGINLIGETELPSRARIEGVLQGMLSLVFPGYFGGRVDARSNLETLVAGRLDTLFVELSGLVARTLNFADGDRGRSAQAETLVLNYLEQLPSVRELVRTDVEAAYEGDPAAGSPVEVILCYPGLLAVAVHRLAHPLQRLGVPFIPRIMAEWAHARTGTDIHPGAEIASHFFIDHATGVVVGETTRIGQRVKLYQGVTLGALSFRKGADGKLVKGGKRHPTIDDDATIYANATILGGETVIGAGAVVGGGCWITSSVAPGAKVTTTARRKDSTDGVVQEPS